MNGAITVPGLGAKSSESEYDLLSGFKHNHRSALSSNLVATVLIRQDLDGAHLSSTRQRQREERGDNPDSPDCSGNLWLHTHVLLSREEVEDVVHILIGDGGTNAHMPHCRCHDPG